MFTTLSIFVVGVLVGVGSTLRWAWRRYGSRVPPERRIAERRDWQE
jgi:hypothetical protein